MSSLWIHQLELRLLDPDVMLKRWAISCHTSMQRMDMRLHASLAIKVYSSLVVLLRSSLGSVPLSHWHKGHISAILLLHSQLLLVFVRVIICSFLS